MDAKELKARVLAQRAFTVERDGFTFSCRLPFDLDMRTIFAEQENRELAGQAVTRKALVGWSGVRSEHVLEDAPEAVANNAIEFEPEWLDLFFADRGALYFDIAGEVFSRIAARQKRVEAAAKN